MLARKFFQHLDDDSSEDNNYSSRLTSKYDITLPAEGHGKRAVLTSVLAPYSHTYMSVVRSLSTLIDYGSMENEFIKACVQQITTKVDNGECKYGTMKLIKCAVHISNLSVFAGESISTDTIRNCMKMLEKCGYIEITNFNGTRIIYLNKKYDNMDGVREITERIESIVVPIDGDH